MHDVTIVNSMTCDRGTSGQRLAAVPLGPLYVVSSLEQAGYHVRFVDYQLHDAEAKPSIATFSKFLEGLHTDIIGLNLYNSCLPTVLGALTEFKRKRPDTTVIFGGPSATDSPVEILTSFPADFVVCGEGEVTMVELMRALESGRSPAEVEGVAWRDNGTVVVNPPRPRVKDLDELPGPAYHHVDMSDYNNCMAIMTARGCPYRCAFCSARSIWQDRVTHRSAANVLAEIEQMAEHTTEIIFFDDTFVLHKSRIREIVDGMKERGIHLGWRCNGRLDRVDVELVKYMVGNGCQEMLLGLESGSDRVLQKIRKRFTRDQALTSLRTLSRLVPRLDVAFIWGFPFETLEEFYDTMSALGEVSRLETDKHIHGHLLCAFPQSPLYWEYGHLAKFSLDLYPTQRAFLPSDRLSNYPDLVQMIEQYPRIMAGFYIYDHPELADKRRLLDRIWPDVEGR